MPNENPPRTDQFWMADPLNILVQTVLTKPFNLEDAQIEVANGQVLQYIDFLSRSKTLDEAWQLRSFYELLVDNTEADENAPKSSHELFVSIFRSNRQMAPTAIDFETYFPAALEQVNIPPVPVPIVPIVVSAQHIRPLLQSCNTAIDRRFASEDARRVVEPAVSVKRSKLLSMAVKRACRAP